MKTYSVDEDVAVNPPGPTEFCPPAMTVPLRWLLSLVNTTSYSLPPPNLVDSTLQLVSAQETKAAEPKHPAQ